MPLTDTDINPGQHNKPAHYPGGAMVGRRDSRLAPSAMPTRITRAARWGHRALPPLRTQYSHAHYARVPLRGPVVVRTARAAWSCAPPVPHGTVPLR